MFRDVIRIRARSGDGGRGCVSFRREKFVPFGGPDGGDGGNGGSVWLVCDPALNHLGNLRNLQVFRAGNGVHGQGKNKHGRNAEDVEIPVPAGTLVYLEEGSISGLEDDDASEDALIDLSTEGQRFLVAAGGNGGRGNVRFKTATRQAPRMAQPGLPGTEVTLRLELKLIAGIGLVGRPNAGKTTLLRALTGSRGKVGAYPFTTLEPNLGVLDLGDWRRVIVADVPGLIAGAHRGEGLGLKFLRHIERTRALLVLVDAASEDGSPIDHYHELCEELRLYRPDLLERPRALVANKIDLDPADDVLTALRDLAGQESIGYYAISAQAGIGLDAVIEWIGARSDDTEAAEHADDPPRVS